MAVAAVMLVAVAAAAPLAPGPSVEVTCERLESVAKSCVRYLKGTLYLLNDACCNGVESIYEALTIDAVDLGFVCRCLRNLVINESLRPYLYRIVNLRDLCRLKDLGPIPYNNSTIQYCRFSGTTRPSL